MKDVVLNPMTGKNAVTRLSQETRSLAGRYLTGKYQHRLKDAGFRLADLNLPADCPLEIQHGKNTILTAEKSSLDILPEEPIVSFFVSEDLLISLGNPNGIFRFFFLAKGNFSKFPRGQITQEGITLTIQHSKRRGSWGYPWLVCKPLLNPPVFWSSPTLLCLVL